MNYFICIFLGIIFLTNSFNANEVSSSNLTKENTLEISNSVYLGNKELVDLLNENSYSELILRKVLFDARPWEEHPYLFFKSSFPHLKKITLDDSNVLFEDADDDFFEDEDDDFSRPKPHFADYAEELNVYNSKVDVCHFDYLLTLPKIKSLNLHNLRLDRPYWGPDIPLPSPYYIRDTFASRDNILTNELEEAHLDNIYHGLTHPNFKPIQYQDLPFSAISAPNLKTLSMKNASFPSTKEEAIVIPAFSNLEHFDLSFENKPNEIHQRGVDLIKESGFLPPQAFAKLLKLKTLSLKGRVFLPEADFSKLQQVEILDLSNAIGFSESVFNTLSGLQNLKKLDMQDIAFSYIPVEAINRLVALLPHCEILYPGMEFVQDPSLQLNVADYSGKKSNGFQELLCQQLIEELDLSRVHWGAMDSEGGFFKAGDFPNLKQLRLDYGKSVDGGNQVYFPFEYFGQFATHLESLSIRGLNLKGIDLRGLSSLLSLKKIDLSDAVLNPENIEQTAYVTLSSLEELHVNNCKLKGLHFDTLAPNVSDLSVKDSNLAAADLARISKLKNLQLLDASNTNITSASIKKLSSLSSLRELSLASTDLKTADFSKLPSSLRKLNLSLVTMSLESFESLFSLTQLEELDVRNMKNPNIGPAEINRLREALPNCKIF